MLYRIKGYARIGLARTKEMLGAENIYNIRGAYRHRSEYSYYDDTGNKDEWQREVYQRAADLMSEQGLTSVTDVGCGSGYKLIEFLGNYQTIGLDVPETVSFLKEKYPDRRWHKPGEIDGEKSDLVICADVIEHVLDPEKLLQDIASLARRYVVLSTPDRDITYHKLSPYQFGPPRNPTHIREWSFNELVGFVGKYFKIVEHSISNQEQWTQMIVATV